MRVVQRQTVCPFCCETHPLATGIRPEHDGIPADGDASLCFECGKLSVFDSKHHGGLRMPTLIERVELAADFDVQMAVAAWRDVRR